MFVLKLRVVMLVDMLLCGLHLDDQVAVVSIDVLRVEDTAARRKRATGFVPTCLIEVIEIISPSELKLILVSVIIVCLNIIKV